MRFGILGTGVVSKTIAARLAGLGHEVMVGTRDPEATRSRTEPDAYGNPPFGVWQQDEALRSSVRERTGRNPEPSASVIDSQSVKTAEGGSRGYDAAKRVCGRKRHLLVDPSGLLLAVHVTPVDTQDRDGARRLLAGLQRLVPRLELIWADGAYGGKDLADWCEQQGGWRLEIVKRSGGSGGFEVVPRRWVVEHTFSWLGRHRRLSKDYERKLHTSEAFIQVAMIRLMLARLATRVG